MSSPAAKPIRILCVDDLLDRPTREKRTLRQSLADALARQENLHLEFATSVKEARQCVRASFYHVVIADHSLAPGYGMEVLREVADYRPSCIRIVITAHPQTEIEGAA